jgi:SnoaL-like domain
VSDERELLRTVYRDFNARRLEDILARMHPDVVWPNGMEGGYVYGHEGVRDYWTRQWKILDPHVEPIKIEPGDQGRFVVEVHQVVHDAEGILLLDTIVHHAYRIRDSLIEKMDIE